MESERWWGRVMTGHHGWMTVTTKEGPLSLWSTLLDCRCGHNSAPVPKTLLTWSSNGEPAQIHRGNPWTYPICLGEESKHHRLSTQKCEGVATLRLVKGRTLHMDSAHLWLEDHQMIFDSIKNLTIRPHVSQRRDDFIEDCPGSVEHQYSESAIYLPAILSILWKLPKWDTIDVFDACRRVNLCPCHLLMVSIKW